MEKTVLYCMLNDFDCRNKALELIDEQFFYDARSRELFKQIYACYIQHDRIDFALIADWMHKNKSLKIVTRDFLYAVAENYSKLDIRNFHVYLNQMIKRRKTDLVINLLGTQHDNIVKDENEIETQIKILQEKLSNISDRCRLEPLKPASVDEMKGNILDSIASNKYAFLWRYNDVDSIAKINRGCFYTVAGRPGTGKTTFSMNVLCRNKQLNSNLKLALFSYEMNAEQLIERFAQINVKTNLKFIEQPIDAVEKAIDGVSDLGIDIYDLTAKNELAIREIIEQNEYDIVVIDYLQNIKSSKEFNNERTKFNYLVDYINTTRRMKETSIILLSQVNRNVDERRPYLRDLKETAAIEESSDLVMFLYARDDVQSEANKNVRYIEAIINKNRYGDLTREDQIILSFNKSNMNFYCTQK